MLIDIRVACQQSFCEDFIGYSFFGKSVRFGYKVSTDEEFPRVEISSM